MLLPHLPMSAQQLAIFPLRTIGMGRGLRRTHLVTLEPVREGAPGWLEDSQFHHWTSEATSSLTTYRTVQSFVTSSRLNMAGLFVSFIWGLSLSPPELGGSPLEAWPGGQQPHCHSLVLLVDSDILSWWLHPRSLVVDPGMVPTAIQASHMEKRFMTA